MDLNELAYDLLDAIEAIDSQLADAIRDDVIGIYDPGTDTYDADCLPALIERLKSEADRLGVKFDADGRPIDPEEEAEQDSYFKRMSE